MALDYTDIDLGDIHFRDRWQFELKSDFIPFSDTDESVYTQEFYIFIPSSLQINQGNYDRTQFYKDQSNYIRYKTPPFRLEQILDADNPLSPLTRLDHLIQSKHSVETADAIEYGIRMLGNVYRSSLRDRVEEVMSHLDEQEIETLCLKVQEFRVRIDDLAKQFDHSWNDPKLSVCFGYIREFISNATHSHLVALLEKIRNAHPHSKGDELVTNILHKEQHWREVNHLESEDGKSDTLHNEYIVYRRGLLNKFVSSALYLSVNRFSFPQTYRHIIAAFSAGIAMLIFMILFVKGGDIFVIHSTPFIIATVIFYILKDRIKEELRSYTSNVVFKFSPDYTTNILTTDQSQRIGELRESFSMRSLNQLPVQIHELRNTGFRTVLDEFHRLEQVLYTKKEVRIKKVETKRHLNALNIIFRLDIHHLVTKASNPEVDVTKISEDGVIIHQKLPKVYHLNVVMINTYFRQDKTKIEEFKKYRIIVDKNGIKRVEHLD